MNGLQKLPLQVRAEAAALAFRKRSRKAIVVEFAGVPKAGKTTTLGSVQAFLRRCGFRVHVVVERASVCPIKDKKDSVFNVWTACTTLVQILDQTQSPSSVDAPEILILDRGIFDSIWWFGLMEELARITRDNRMQVERFLLMDEWRKRISGVVVMLATPEDSLQREKGHLPVEGKEGSIMNPQVLGKTRDVVENTVHRLNDKFEFFVVDTSSGKFVNKQKDTCEAVASKILDWVEGHIEEQVFSLEKSILKNFFGNEEFLKASDTKNLEQQFLSTGNYKARSFVEQDFARVQALPVVVVRNQTGDILLLRRKETREDNALHEKLVIWAGGHVRSEDSAVGNPLTICAVRELEEELRLRVEPSELNLLGSVYVDDEKNSSKHVAFVYEWRAPSDYVTVALNNSEFFERNGTSSSCNFAEIAYLEEKMKVGELTEPWSTHILKQFLFQ